MLFKEGRITESVFNHVIEDRKGSKEREVRASRVLTKEYDENTSTYRMAATRLEAGLQNQSRIAGASSIIPFRMCLP